MPPGVGLLFRVRGGRCVHYLSPGWWGNAFWAVRAQQPSLSWSLSVGRDQNGYITTPLLGVPVVGRKQPKTEWMSWK